MGFAWLTISSVPSGSSKDSDETVIYANPPTHQPTNPPTHQEQAHRRLRRLSHLLYRQYGCSEVLLRGVLEPMYRFLSNIGSADELRKRVAEALSANGPVYLILDIPRTVSVENASRSEDELIVMCSDNDDGTTIVLHLPYESNSAAQADMIFYK